jgi:pimeloyl-ACP methyl ester carboxylesterase
VHRIPVRRRSLAAALLAVAVLIGLFAATPTAHAKQAPSAVPPGVATQAAHAGGLSSGAKPTIVLVHGAWADSSSWTGVVTRLQRQGYRVLAPPNPLRSLSGDAAYIRAFLATVPGPIVLVGHSYGGAVITNAATGNPNVRALVYVNAFVPDEGEAVLPLAGPDSALAVADPTTVFDLRPYPGAAAGDFDIYLKPNVVTDYFAPDLPRRTALAMAATQRPIALSAGSEPSGQPAWRTTPSWYLIGTQDLIIPPAQQRFMAERADAHIVEVKASHVSLISKPQTVARLITTAAQATS